MLRCLTLTAGLLVGCVWSLPAGAADYEGWQRHDHGGYRHHEPHSAAWRDHGRHRSSYRRAGVGPVFYPDAGDTAPIGGRVVIAEYREAYIGRGLIYNVPPEPRHRWSHAIRARY